MKFRHVQNRYRHVNRFRGHKCHRGRVIFNQRHRSGPEFLMSDTFRDRQTRQLNPAARCKGELKRWDLVYATLTNGHEMQALLLRVKKRHAIGYVWSRLGCNWCRRRFTPVTHACGKDACAHTNPHDQYMLLLQNSCDTHCCALCLPVAMREHQHAMLPLTQIVKIPLGAISDISMYGDHNNWKRMRTKHLMFSSNGAPSLDDNIRLERDDPKGPVRAHYQRRRDCVFHFCPGPLDQGIQHTDHDGNVWPEHDHECCGSCEACCAIRALFYVRCVYPGESFFLKCRDTENSLL